MAGVGALAITAGATLLGVLIPTLATLWLTHESNTQTRLYRNHEKRISIAEEYLRALGSFRRTIREYADARGAKAGDTYKVMIAAARSAADAGEFLRLYFDDTVRTSAEQAGNFLLKMQQRAEEMVKNSDDDHTELERWDESGKQARDVLINSMKSQLGEPEVRTRPRPWRRSTPSSWVGPRAVLRRAFAFLPGDSRGNDPRARQVTLGENRPDRWGPARIVFVEGSSSACR